ncbi:type II toxin-antitoxin system RelB/DinJ family antitoxin [Acetobacter pasteurianus]
MASINLRIDDSLKKAAYERLSALGVTPSDLICQTFEYVVKTGKLPVRRTVISEEDQQLLAVVRERLERLASPEPSIPVSLDDL